MALVVVKTGLVTLKAEFSAGTIVDVGQAENMTEVREIPFWHNVPGDAHGGPEGPPIEIQFLGAIAKIRITMSKWDTTHVATIRKFAVATQGTILAAEVGTLMLANKTFRIILSAVSLPLPLNFPCVFPRDPVEYAVGTKYSAMMIEFEAHKHPTTEVLYNAVTTPS